MFGSIFLLAQYFRVAQGYSPLGAGLRTLPWTAVPIFIAPLAGILSDRIGSRPLLVVGMVLMTAGLAWIAAVSTPGTEYLRVVPGLVLSGTGMSLFFAPTANLVLGSVRKEEEGQASGANNAIREIGGVFGVAVLASVFASRGGYASPASFVDGLVPAVWVGAAIVSLGIVAALAVPALRRSVTIDVHAAPVRLGGELALVPEAVMTDEGALAHR
jgi:MFS family permease